MVRTELEVDGPGEAACGDVGEVKEEVGGYGSAEEEEACEGEEGGTQVGTLSRFGGSIRKRL